MADRDPLRERHRLDELYKDKSDEELQELAEDPGSLTDVARDALSAEMSRRGLAIATSTPCPGTDGIDTAGLVTVAGFADITNATLAKGLLESAGIEVTMSDQYAVGVQFMGYALRLMVRREDADEASRLLADVDKAGLSDELDGETDAQ